MWKLVLVSIGAARALKDGDVKCGGLEKKACKKVCDERGWCSRDVDYLGPLCKWDKNANACMTVNALGEWADEEACVQLKKKKKAKSLHLSSTMVLVWLRVDLLVTMHPVPCSHRL
jgi:hypothetical protein